MSAPLISNGDMVEIQLRKHIRKGFVDNVTLRPTYSHPSVPAGETVVAEVIDRQGQGLFFTCTGFTLPGHGFIRYDDVMKVDWISSLNWDKVETLSVKSKRKREDFDHIEFALRDGTSVTLMDVRKAVFPLLHFFQWMVWRRTQKT